MQEMKGKRRSDFKERFGNKILEILKSIIDCSGEERVFRVSLAVSFLVHFFILASLFYRNFHDNKKFRKNVEVIYQMEVREADKQVQRARKAQKLERQKLNPAPEILTKKSVGSAAVFKKVVKQPGEIPVHKKQRAHVRSLEGKRQILVPMLSSEKITNPKYLNYNERIRNRIKNRAYFYIDDPDFGNGEVYLTFVISSDGALQKVKIINDKTKANNYLRSVGLRSIEDSAPFPPFPSDLRYPELTFNIVISFEVSQ